MNLLIRNAAAILTGLNGGEARHAGPDIRIRDGRIAAIGALAPQPGERQIDASGCVVYPAWVNTHHHLFQSLLKGDPLGINATLTPWLHGDADAPAAAHGRRACSAWRRASAWSNWRCRAARTVADHNYHYYPGMPFDGSAILFDEARQAGPALRAVPRRRHAVAPAGSDLPPALRPETLDVYLADIERLARELPRPGAGRHAPHRRGADDAAAFDAPAGTARDGARTARRLGLRLHSHLSETVHYHDTVHAQHGDQAGALLRERSTGWAPTCGSRTWSSSTPTRSRCSARRSTGIAHCPQSNGRLGSGIAPVRALEAAGATDLDRRRRRGIERGGRHAVRDARSLADAARARPARRRSPMHRGGSGEDDAAAAATVEDVVRWGTAGGAEVLGLAAIGTLVAGQAADIAVYAPRPRPALLRPARPGHRPGGQRRRSASRKRC